MEAEKLERAALLRLFAKEYRQRFGPVSLSTQDVLAAWHALGLHEANIDAVRDELRCRFGLPKETFGKKWWLPLRQPDD